MTEQIDKAIDIIQHRIGDLSKRPFRNLFPIRRLKKQVLALQEGARDVTTTQITNAATGTKVVDKNNYKTYPSKVTGSYNMYNSRVDYGGELHQAIVNSRVSFIAGEGITIQTKNEATHKWIEDFFTKNKLFGSKLLSIIRISELEGKNLLILTPKKDKDDSKESFIKVSSFSWHTNNYAVHTDPQDTDEIKDITYKDKKDISGKEKHINPNRSVYVKIGGTEDRIDEATNRIHCILTDIENYSRSKYDLRKNAHLFGKITPYWKTSPGDKAAADSIKADVNGFSWQPGYGYAGPADFAYIGPPGDGDKLLISDHLTALRTISAMTGIPIHWLSWPDLMSNRATAESLLEVILSATRNERLIWQEAFKELVKKAMILAIDNLGASNSIQDDFEIVLDFASIALLKQVAEVWVPLVGMGAISMETLRSKLPGVDSTQEEKYIEEETDAMIEQTPFQNKTLNKTMDKKEDKNKKDDKNGNKG